MTEEMKIRIVTFYSYYGIALFVFTLFFYWFDAGDPVSWLWLLLLVGIPFPLLRYRERRRRDSERKGRKQAESLFGFLLIAGGMAIPWGILDERSDNFWLACIFYASAVGLCFVGLYLRGRYLILYCNPSVSKETRRRFGDKMKKYGFGMLLLGLAVLIVCLLAAQYEPEIRLQAPQKTNTQWQEQERMEPSAGRQSDRREEVREEQKKQGNNIFLVILRYIVTIAILVMGIVAAVYGLFRLFFFLLRRRKKQVWEFEEIEVAESAREEYTRLVPVRRKQVSFPAGADGRVRRLFYKEIRRQAGKKEIVLSQTPTELKDSWLKPDPKSELLTELYEKARYAKDSVTSEEISRLED